MRAHLVVFVVRELPPLRQLWTLHQLNTNTDANTNAILLVRIADDRDCLPFLGFVFLVRSEPNVRSIRHGVAEQHTHWVSDVANPTPVRC